MEIKKILVVSIILLFIGVAVAPSINQSVVKASTDDDLVEVTTQACGIQGYTDTTVKLTREQYQHLEQYLVEFRARLNQTSTREEAVPLFKDAVVELDNYGLLPRGMSVEQAQRLVIRQYQNKNLENLQKKFLHNHLIALDDDNNYLCLVVGRTNYTYSTNFIAEGLLDCGGLLFLLGLKVWNNLQKSFFSLLLSVFLLFSSVALVYLVTFLQVIINVNPFAIVNILGIGGGIGYVGFGWVKTIGLLGVKNWEGKLKGTLPGIIGTINPPFEFYPAIGGFSGIKIWPKGEDLEKTYLGSAIRVGLNEIN